MLINAQSFMYDNKSSNEFGLILCTVGGASNESGNGGSALSFMTNSSPIQNKWKKFGNSVYANALTFTLTVAKKNFTFFDQQEISILERWLVKKDAYKEFRFVKWDYSDIVFYAMVSNIAYEKVSGEVIALTIDFECNAPFGFAHMVTKTLDTSTGGNSLTIVDMSDEIGFIYPDITLNITKAGAITIVNSFDKRTTTLYNCIANEVITINGDILQIQSDVTTHNLYEDFNYIFPRVCNDMNKRENIFTITGNCVMTLSYRPIKKVGV